MLQSASDSPLHTKMTYHSMSYFELSIQLRLLNVFEFPRANSHLPSALL